MKRFAILVGTMLLLGIAAAALAWPERSHHKVQHSAPPEQVAASSGHEAHAASERTVLVADKPQLGANEGVLTVGLERGTMPPASEVDAEVLTDENCTPDAQGVSHCRNEIRMEGGKTVRIQHDHRMHEVPCLVPGERLRLRAA